MAAVESSRRRIRYRRRIRKNGNIGYQAPSEAGIKTGQSQVVEEPNKAGAHKSSPCTAAHGLTDAHGERPRSTS